MLIIDCLALFVLAVDCMALVFAVMHLYNIFNLNPVLINRRNGQRYQRVLVVCAFLTGAIPKGLILRKFCI